jgi:hypothetical protein
VSFFYFYLVAFIGNSSLMPKILLVTDQMAAGLLVNSLWISVVQ